MTSDKQRLQKGSIGSAQRSGATEICFNGTKSKETLRVTDFQHTRRQKTRRRSDTEAMANTDDHIRSRPIMSTALSTTAFKRHPVIVYCKPPKTLSVCSVHFRSVVQSLTGSSATHARRWRRGCPCYLSSSTANENSRVLIAKPPTQISPTILPFQDPLVGGDVPDRHCSRFAGGRGPPLIRPVPLYATPTHASTSTKVGFATNRYDAVNKKIHHRGTEQKPQCFVLPALYKMSDGPQTTFSYINGEQQGPDDELKISQSYLDQQFAWNLETMIEEDFMNMEPVTGYRTKWAIHNEEDQEWAT
ncbi:hypothetical protein KP509_29G043100 [Ceratopteris richardii]|uniref:VQ domain-containing protein n=1 Tax=Ceratopteris richardii TaxID=49495 RepID=A0A8T2R7G2_CERRI|nr:hypothetical protein KP509_29G043100 [Ceratopteris richardii]